MIKLACGSCGKLHECPDDWAGKIARCRCGARFRVTKELPALVPAYAVHDARPQQRVVVKNQNTEDVMGCIKWAFLLFVVIPVVVLFILAAAG